MGETKKVCYVGAPAVFALELACQHVNAALGHYGCYIVGSCMERADWRDVDVRFIMADEDFSILFPSVDLTIGSAVWEFDPRWLLFNTAICQWLRTQTGLPIDFQIQPQTFANAHHGGHRSAVGLRVAKREPRSLTESEMKAVQEFEKEMETETIPEVLETIRQRQESANEFKGVLG